MSSIRFRAAAVLFALSITACAGLKDALTSHTDLVARAGSQELSVQRLSSMMAAANAPARKDVAIAITNIWVNYQLLGQASAKGDSMTDQKIVNDAMWAQVAQVKLKKLFAEVAKKAPAADPATYEKHFNDGDMLAARHILFLAKKVGAKPGEREAAKKKATDLAKTLTAANFGEMAKKYSEDPGSKANGGDVGVFKKGTMVTEFYDGTAALKPGQISGPVETEYGYHIIMRETYADSKDGFAAEYGKGSQQSAESTYGANIEKAAKVEVKPGAAKTIRAIAADLDSYRDDKTPVATAKNVNMNAAAVAKWMGAYPAQMKIREQLAQLPDSMVGLFARQLVVNELMIHAADSAKLGLDSTEQSGIRNVFTGSVMNSMVGLGLAPKTLADSAKGGSAREKFAADHVEKFMDLLLANKAQFVDVSEPVSRALRSKFETRVLAPGIDKAVTEATKLIAKADSAKAKAAPPSAVPAPGVAAPAAAAPAAAAPAPAPTKKP